MRIRFAACTTAALLISAISSSSGQSIDAIAGWLSLGYSPIGGLTPLVPDLGADATTQVSFATRTGTVKSTRRKTSVTVGALFSTRKYRILAEVGRMSIANCVDCAGILGGVDAIVPIESFIRTMRSDEPADSARELRIALNPAVGFMKPTRGDGKDWTASFALSLPLSTVIRFGNTSRLVPFLSPGLGMGRFNSRTNSQSGSRFMLGGGLALTNYFPGVEITAGFRKIIITGPTGTIVYGVGLTWGRH